MGGILAMHLVNRFQNQVDSLVLNDIGLYLHWSALMSLYQRIKDSDEKLHTLKVDVRAIKAVQSSSHFDLPYEFDLLGMQFYSLLKNFAGRVVLLHNETSPICPLNVANLSKTKFADLKIWTLSKDGHPAHWEKSTVIKLAQLVRLKPKSIDKSELQVSLQNTETVPASSAFSLDLINTFLKTSKAHLESTTQDHSLWFIRLVNRLKFWKKKYS